MSNTTYECQKVECLWCIESSRQFRNSQRSSRSCQYTSYSCCWIWSETPMWIRMRWCVQQFAKRRDATMTASSANGTERGIVTTRIHSVGICCNNYSSDTRTMLPCKNLPQGLLSWAKRSNNLIILCEIEIGSSRDASIQFNSSNLTEIWGLPALTVSIRPKAG